MRHRFLGMFLVLTCGLFVFASTTAAQQQPVLVIKGLVEKKVSQLPAGPLFWRIETFPTIAQARAAAGPMGLAAESAGKAWLFTLGPAGGSTAGGVKIVEIGPLPPVSAPEYLLRINEATGPPGSISAVHSHPGSEAAYVLTGQLNIRTREGILLIAAGQTAVVAGGGPMQAASGGSTDLHELAMWVVDATKPFSSPASF